jgi:hypothetical protein
MTGILKMSKLIIAFSIIVGLGACTTVYEAPDELVSGYTTDKEIDLNVGLQITDELRDAKWERKSMGDTFVIPLGDSLTENSEELAKELFSSVTVGENIASFEAGNFDAILTPKLAAVDQTQAAWAFGDSTLTLFVEWEMRNSAGELVWIDTVKGEGVSHTGNVFTHKGEATKRIKQAIDTLFLESHDVISTSAEVRAFAASP